MPVHLHVQQAIDAPPEKVFAAITDLHAGGRWLMAPLMKGVFQKALHKDHAALKAHVEASPPPDPSRPGRLERSTAPQRGR